MDLQSRARIIIENATKALGEETVRAGAVDLLLDNIPELKSWDQAKALLDSLKFPYSDQAAPGKAPGMYRGFDTRTFQKTIGHYWLSVIVNHQGTRFESVIMRVTPGGLPVSGFMPLVSCRDLSEDFKLLRTTHQVDTFICNQTDWEGGK